VPEDSCGDDCCDIDCQPGTEVILLDESNLNSTSSLVREITVPANKTLVITTQGGSGDVDLLVKFGSEPVFWDKDCVSNSSSNDELCTITPTQSGTYFVLLDSFGAFTDVRLIAKYQ
jgi:hypothetical protein